MNFETGSDSFHLPCSHSCIIATPVIGLVIEAMRKIESVFSGSPVAAFAAP
jgi:hypothetical protein